MRPDFARPEAACVDHMFGVDRAFVGDHIPCAIRALVGLFDHAVGFDRGAAHAGGFGIGVGCARGIKVPIKRIIKPANDAIEIGDGRDFLDFVGADDLCFQPHEAVLGALGQQHIEAVLIVGQGHAADMVQTAGHACDLFQALCKA